MAIQLSQLNYWELVAEDDSNWQLYDPADDLDWIGTYPAKLGQGQIRGIELQAGLVLDIANYHLHDDLLMYSVDRDHPIEFTFYLGGAQQERDREFRAGMYGFFGSGMAPGSHGMHLSAQPTQWVSVHMNPALLHSFVGIRSEEIPPELKHLLRRSDQEYYSRYGITTSAMQAVVVQILRCPYEGLTKRIFLESKVLELLALFLDQEQIIRACGTRVPSLKPDDIDRIHHARKILLQNLCHPPSLRELARAVGTNDRKLKQGFRQVFGTTVFGCLHDYRMEQARSLLKKRRLSVKEVARMVGYASSTSFHAAFRKKFGVAPGNYLKVF